MNGCYKNKWILVFLFMGLFFRSAPLYSQQWTSVGDHQFSDGDVDFVSLDFEPGSGTPYLAYEDVSAGGKVTVRKFDGNSWVPLGNKGFTDSNSTHVKLAFSPTTSEPYVAYENGGLTVKKFNGNDWVTVGSKGASDGGIDDLDLAFKPGTSTPYVTFHDYSNGGKTGVMKFNGSSWVYVGNKGFSNGESFHQALAFHPGSKAPYVAYSDHSLGGGLYYGVATVRKYDGNSWQTVGASGFSPGAADDISLAFDPVAEEPYVAFGDHTQSNTYSATTVMKYANGSWSTVGNGGFSGGPSNGNQIAFDPASKIPYVVFEDAASAGTVVEKFEAGVWVNVGDDPIISTMKSTHSLGFRPGSENPYIALAESDLGDEATVMSVGTLSSVEDQTSKGSELSIFPNPGGEKFFIEGGKSQEQLSLKVYNIHGRLLLQKEFTRTDRKAVDMKGAESGTYFIELSDGKKKSVMKWVKF